MRQRGPELRYFLDGYNCLFTLFPSLGPLQDERDRFLELLASMGFPSPLVVVFDGEDPDYSRRTHIDTLEIVYTTSGETADDYILHELEHQKGCVITNDRELTHRAKLLGSKALSINAFWNQKKKQPAKSKKEVLSLRFPETENERWLRIFQKRLEDNSLND